MKHILLSLMIVLMSMITSTPASAKTDKSDVKKTVPTNIVVKQTTTFNEVYSPCNAKDYEVADAAKIKSTNFEVVDKTEGKLYRKATIGEVVGIIKKLVNQYL